MDEMATLKIPYDSTLVLFKIPYDVILIPTKEYPITPLVITMPSPFPFERTKVILWNYDSTVYIYGLEVEEEQLKSRKQV